MFTQMQIARAAKVGLDKVHKDIKKGRLNPANIDSLVSYVLGNKLLNGGLDDVVKNVGESIKDAISTPNGVSGDVSNCGEGSKNELHYEPCDEWGA